MKILCLTGWQQPADALRCIAPPDALHARYGEESDVAGFLRSLPEKVDVAIGWSLGGQLLVRAIAGGYVTAHKLVLLGAPFQFLAGGDHAEGMPADKFPAIVENYRSDPQGMVRQFAGIISAGDIYAPRIARELGKSREVWRHGLFWLEELGRFSCAGLDFAGFPPTLLVHGEKDQVIYPGQARLFAARLPQATLHLLPGCAHAPHLHAPERLREFACV